jgi:hypothetical protein
LWQHNDDLRCTRRRQHAEFSEMIAEIACLCTAARWSRRGDAAAHLD